MFSLLLTTAVAAILLRVFAGNLLRLVGRGIRWIFASGTNAHVFLGRSLFIGALLAFPAYAVAPTVAAFILGLPLSSIAWVFVSVIGFVSLVIHLFSARYGVAQTMITGNKSRTDVWG